MMPLCRFTVERLLLPVLAALLSIYTVSPLAAQARQPALSASSAAVQLGLVPFKGLPYDVVEPPRNVEAKDYKPFYCLRWSDGCTECSQKTLSGPVTCVPKPRVFTSDCVTVPYAKPASGGVMRACHDKPSKQPDMCDRHPIVCLGVNQDTLDYYCSDVLNTGVLNANTTLIDAYESPGETKLTDKLVLYKVPTQDYYGGDRMVYDARAVLWIYGISRVDNKYAPVPDGETLLLGKGVGCSGVRRGFDLLSDIRSFIDRIDPQAVHPARTLNPWSIRRR